MYSSTSACPGVALLFSEFPGGELTGTRAPWKRSPPGKMGRIYYKTVGRGDGISPLGQKLHTVIKVSVPLSKTKCWVGWVY